MNTKIQNYKNKIKKDFVKIYADFLKKSLNPARPLKVVFDCSNGTTGIILKQFQISNFKFQIINGISDGNFPGHGPNPWAKGAMEQLQKEVLKQKADLGIIFDADGDRVFFIDNLGRIIEPDIIARLLIWQTQPKKVVYDIRTGWLISKFKISNLKFKIYKSKVGHFYIKELMRKIGADLGVEKSGHYYFQIAKQRKSTDAKLREKTFFYDDGLLAAVKIINAVSRLPYFLADFADLLPQYYRSGEINIKFDPTAGGLNPESQKLLFKKIERYYNVKTKIQKLKPKTSYLDGLTMEFKDDLAGRRLGEGWWFNLRPSNTESLIRLNIEAGNKQLLENKKGELIELITTHITT